MCIDVKDFYLITPIEDKEYMRIPTHVVPAEFIQEQNLQNKIKDGYTCERIDNGMCVLPQAGLLVNKLLKKRLAKHGYFEIITPGL